MFKITGSQLYMDLDHTAHDEVFQNAMSLWSSTSVANNQVKYGLENIHTPSPPPRSKEKLYGGGGGYLTRLREV